MNKDIKELIFILLLAVPILTMLLMSAFVDSPVDIDVSNLNRTYMLVGNSLSLLFFFLPYLAIRKNKKYNMNFSKFDIKGVSILLFSFLFFIVFNSLIIEWNKGIVFPEFMNQFEAWALSKEKQLAKLTVFLISFESFNEYLIGVLAIAIIPGILEEFFFRGILQKNILLISRNPHLAIWISAIIFSFIHLQFYGFFPRMIMGVLFGYIFYWSGSLTYPIIAHIFNNFFSLTLFYAANEGLFGPDFKVDINSSPDIPFYIIIFSFMVFSFSIFYLRKHFKKIS